MDAVWVSSYEKEGRKREGKRSDCGEEGRKASLHLPRRSKVSVVSLGRGS